MTAPTYDPRDVQVAREALQPTQAPRGWRATSPCALVRKCERGALLRGPPPEFIVYGGLKRGNGVDPASASAGWDPLTSFDS